MIKVGLNDGTHGMRDQAGTSAENRLSKSECSGGGSLRSDYLEFCCLSWDFRASVSILRRLTTVCHSFMESSSRQRMLSCRMDKKLLTELARYFEPDVPYAWEQINRLLFDETFYEICTDLLECAKCLRHWVESPGEQKDRITEYTELIADLQQEILQYLQEHQT